MESGKTSLKQVIQGISGAGAAEVLQGTVLTASPLKIQIAGDEKHTVGPNITVVPEHLTDYTAGCTISGGSVSGTTSDGSTLTDFSYTGSITVHNALRAGDQVHVLSYNGRKQYFVLGRVG